MADCVSGTSYAQWKWSHGNTWFEYIESITEKHCMRLLFYLHVFNNYCTYTQENILIYEKLGIMLKYIGSRSWYINTAWNSDQWRAKSFTPKTVNFSAAQRNTLQ